MSPLFPNLTLAAVLIAASVPLDCRADEEEDLYAQAAGQYSAGRFTEAAESFQAFAARFPKSRRLPAVRLAHGWALMKLHRPAEAATLFQQVMSDPKLGMEARAWLRHAGEALVRSGDAQAAVKVLEPLATSGGEGALEARSFLAVAYARTGQMEKAKAIYAEFLEKHPRHGRMVPLTQQLAEAAYDAGDAAWSDQLFTRLAAQDGMPQQKLTALAGQGWSQFKAGKLEEAATTFGRVLNQSPDATLGAETALVRGRIFEKLGRPDPALAMYDLVLERYSSSPQVSPALLAAARLRQKLKQDAQAAALFERWVKAFPESSEMDAALYQWAWSLSDLGRKDQALAVFERLSKEHRQSPYWADATYRLAQRAAEAKEHAQALELLDAVLASKPHPAIRENALFLKGQIAAALEKWAEARETWEALIQDAPKSTLRLMAEYGVAEAQFHQGEYAGAAVKLERLIKEAATERALPVARLKLRLAQALGHQKRWDEAYAIAAKIEQEHPGFEEQADVEYLIGRCLASRADFEGAREAYRRALRAQGAAKDQVAVHARLMIAESYFHQEDYEAALGEYMAVASSDAMPAERAAALVQAGKCHELLQQWSQATRLYGQVVKEYATTAYAKEAAKREQIVRQR